MNCKYKIAFFDLTEVSSALKCTEEELLRLVREKKIPHSITPLGKILFDSERLREWVLSFEQTTEYASEGRSERTKGSISLTEEICRRFGYKTRASRKWLNLCLGQIVFAQLHPRRKGDGVDLALRECGNDSNLPGCTVLKKINLRELSGYWKTNISWLDGDRWTKSPAAAYHVPSMLEDDAENPGWKEIELLLSYAEKKFMTA